MKVPVVVGIGVLLFVVLGCSKEPAPAVQAGDAAPAANKRPGTVVDDAAMADEAAGENWLAFGRTYSEQRFSPLKQVNDGNVGSLGVDWYVGNCHKWLCAPKGAAFVWAAPERQAGLHPTVISHDLGKGWTWEFDKIGTRDASAWLSVPAALAFHEDLGGARMRTRCHRVAVAEDGRTGIGGRRRTGVQLGEGGVRELLAGLLPIGMNRLQGTLEDRLLA